jgi:hypothetical protein
MSPFEPASMRHLAMALCSISVFCANAGAQAVTRDSAAIRIVESTRPAWGTERRWRLSDTPVLTIGREDGEAAYLFSNLRGALRLSDGRIVVADGRSDQLRFFDATGRFLASAAGTGGGPGEVTSLTLLWLLPGDTVAVNNGGDGISVYDPAGRYIRSIPIRGERLLSPLGQFATGAILAYSGSRGFSGSDVGSVIRDSLRFHLGAPDWSSSRVITVHPSAERWGLLAGGIAEFPYLPFAADPVWAVSPATFYVGSGRENEIRGWNSDGRLTRIVRWSTPDPRAVTEQDIARYRSHLVGSTSDANQRRRYDTFLAQAPMAERVPAYRSLAVDDDGNLWVEAWRPPWDDQPEWLIFSADGAWLGSVTMPSRFTVYNIGGDFVIGSWRDGLDVEYVRMYRLSRSERDRFDDHDLY